jgi:hypothetical protein
VASIARNRRRNIWAYTDLLGHKSQRTTTHYLHPELSNLIAAAEKDLSLYILRE